MYRAEQHLPLKVNMAGVIPAIFASSLLLFPASLGQWFGQSPGMEWLQDLSLQIAPGQPLNLILFSAGIIFFCFWYTAMFNPKEVAENLKKSGAFILAIGQEIKHPTYRYDFDEADTVWFFVHDCGMPVTSVFYCAV